MHTKMSPEEEEERDELLAEVVDPTYLLNRETELEDAVVLDI